VEQILLLRMDVQAQRFAKQKWLPQKAKELLTLPAVSSPGDDEGKNQDGGERVVGKMTASKIKIEEMCDHFRSESGEQELRARIVEYDAKVRAERKEKLRAAGQNFVTANKLILTPLQSNEEQQHMFDELRFRSRSACIRRNIILAERQRYYIDAKTDTKELKHARDSTFSDCVKDLVSSRLIYLQKAWLAKVLFALGTQKFIDAMQRSKQQRTFNKQLKASKIIMRLLRRAARNRQRYDAANMLVEVLKAFAEMSRIKIFVMRLKKGVLFAQRQFRKRQRMTGYHIALLLQQWRRLERKQLSTAPPGTPKLQRSETLSSTASTPTSPSRGINRTRSPGRRTSSSAMPSSPSSRQGKPQTTPVSPAQGNFATVKVPDATKVKFLKPWLLGKRQEYTFNRCMYEKYEVWPQLVEFVSNQRNVNGQKLCRDRRKARELCERLRRRGRMVSYLEEHGEVLPKPPKFCRFVEEPVLLDMQERAISQVKTENALAASLLGSSFLDEGSDISQSPSMSPTSRGGRTPKGGKKKGKKGKKKK
jgi:hypothetical protein